MAITVTKDTKNKYVSWGTFATAENLSTISILSWCNIVSFGADVGLNTPNYAAHTNGTSTGWYFYNYDVGRNLAFFIYSSGTDGTWYTANNTVNTGNHFFAVTYNKTSNANTPTFYIDGASSALFSSTQPTGTIASWTSATLSVANDTTGTFYGLDGSYFSTNIHNVILSASEIADIYASKNPLHNTRGLVFAPQLHGAAGNVGESGTLAAGNTIADMVTGALGVPAGSPLFKQDTYLTYR